MLHYAATRQSIPEIAEQLDVDSIIEGSVRYADNRIRVTIQLVDGASDEHLWSQSLILTLFVNYYDLQHYIIHIKIKCP